MKDANRKIAEAAKKRGYHEYIAYFIPRYGSTYVYLCPGVAMDQRRSPEEKVETTILWASDNIQDLDSIYALRPKTKNIKNDMSYVSDWCIDDTVFDDMDGNVLEAHIITKQYVPVTLPAIAPVRCEFDEFGQEERLWIDIVLDPQITGRRYSQKVYPDKSWTDIHVGCAVIEKIMYKSDICALVSGHMITTYRVSLSQFFEKHRCSMDAIESVWIHDYDAKDDTGIIEYSCGDAHYVDYAVLDDDGTIREIQRRGIEDTQYEDDENKISVPMKVLENLHSFRNFMRKYQLQ